MTKSLCTASIYSGCMQVPLMFVGVSHTREIIISCLYLKNREFCVRRMWIPSEEKYNWQGWHEALEETKCAAWLFWKVLNYYYELTSLSILPQSFLNLGRPATRILNKDMHTYTTHTTHWNLIQKTSSDWMNRQIPIHKTSNPWTDMG